MAAVCTVFVTALLIRLVNLGLLTVLLGLDYSRAASLFDGSSYITIAESFPLVYQGLELESTKHFPLYPFLIFLLTYLTQDPACSALLISMLLSSAAVGVFYLIAKDFTTHPLLPALLFTVFPPKWLDTGTLVFSEPTFMFCFLLAVWFFRHKKHGLAALASALASLARPPGVLTVAILGLSLLFSQEKKSLSALGFYLIAPLGLLLFQLYLWDLFHVLPASYIANREEWGAFGVLPFSALLKGLAGPGDGIVRKIFVTVHVVLYTWGWWESYRCRKEYGLELFLWVTAFTLLTAFHGGGTEVNWGYFSYLRFMIPAAPPTILLLARKIPPHLGPYAFAAAGLLGFVHTSFNVYRHQAGIIRLG